MSFFLDVLGARIVSVSRAIQPRYDGHTSTERLSKMEELLDLSGDIRFLYNL